MRRDWRWHVGITDNLLLAGPRGPRGAEFRKRTDADARVIRNGILRWVRAQGVRGGRGYGGRGRGGGVRAALPSSVGNREEGMFTANIVH